MSRCLLVVHLLVQQSVSVFRWWVERPTDSDVEPVRRHLLFYKVNVSENGASTDDLAGTQAGAQRPKISGLVSRNYSKTYGVGQKRSGLIETAKVGWLRGQQAVEGVGIYVVNTGLCLRQRCTHTNGHWSCMCCKNSRCVLAFLGHRNVHSRFWPKICTKTTGHKWMRVNSAERANIIQQAMCGEFVLITLDVWNLGKWLDNWVNTGWLEWAW